MSRTGRETMKDLKTLNVVALRDQLLEGYGSQEAWWPAEDDFEMMVGSVLVQRTRWENAAMSIARLKEASVLSPRGIRSLETTEVQELIRPSGFKTAKATTLQRLSEWVQDTDVELLEPAEIRSQLLSIRGIGPETADVIALYVYDCPVFIADEYARRLLKRTMI